MTSIFDTHVRFSFNSVLHALNQLQTGGANVMDFRIDGIPQNPLEVSSRLKTLPFLSILFFTSNYSA